MKEQRNTDWVRDDPYRVLRIGSESRLEEWVRDMDDYNISYYFRNRRWKELLSEAALNNRLDLVDYIHKRQKIDLTLPLPTLVRIIERGLTEIFNYFKPWNKALFQGILTYAIKSSNEIFKDLINEIEDLDWGVSAYLRTAIVQGNDFAFDLLLERGANPILDDGPLYIASVFGQERMVEEILKRKPPKEFINSKLLFQVKRNDHHKVERMLRNYLGSLQEAEFVRRDPYETLGLGFWSRFQPPCVIKNRIGIKDFKREKSFLSPESFSFLEALEFKNDDVLITLIPFELEASALNFLKSALRKDGKPHFFDHYGRVNWRGSKRDVPKIFEIIYLKDGKRLNESWEREDIKGALRIGYNPKVVSEWKKEVGAFLEGRLPSIPEGLELLDEGGLLRPIYFRHREDPKGAAGEIEEEYNRVFRFPGEREYRRSPRYSDLDGIFGWKLGIFSIDKKLPKKIHIKRINSRKEHLPYRDLFYWAERLGHENWYFLSEAKKKEVLSEWYNKNPNVLDEFKGDYRGDLYSLENEILIVKPGEKVEKAILGNFIAYPGEFDEKEMIGLINFYKAHPEEFKSRTLEDVFSDKLRREHQIIVT